MDVMAFDSVLGHVEMLANHALSLWDLPPESTTRLINVSENVTFLVEAGSQRWVLRVHREGYHTKRAIECELAWSGALRTEGTVATPAFIPGKDGEAIQQAGIDGLAHPRFMVLFEHVDGLQPSEDQELAAAFHSLGEIAARTHLHSMSWRRPQLFERLKWNLDTIFGEYPTWGNWRDGPGVTGTIRVILERVEETVIGRLRRFGERSDRYGLIHADMRLANLLIDGETTHLIDFDDCGFGWFLYDFAAAISFMEDSPQVPALRQAWADGYRRLRPLPINEEREMETFVMLRRLALLGWIGSHMEAPEPQALAPDFAGISAELGENYLTRFT